LISTVEAFRGQQLARRLLNGYLQRRRVAGTFLLLGQRGLGKTTLGTILARALCCEQNRDAPRLWFCGKCYACRTIAAGDQPEYTVVRPRSKQITITMIEKEFGGFASASLHPTLLSHRIFAIQDAHYLNEQSANQLLKLFEEPPAQTVFILDTDQPELMLPTILSRGQKIVLTPLPFDELTATVHADQPDADEPACVEAARMAAGRYVDAMRLAGAADWRAAVKKLADVLGHGERYQAPAEELAQFELEALWHKELHDTGLDAEEAEKMIARAKTDEEKGLRTRLNELTRQALITAYNRAAWWHLQEAALPPGFLKALTELKARINQNVDPGLAQAAFEIALAKEFKPAAS